MQAISEAVRPSGSHGTSGLYCSIVMPVASKPVSGGKLVEGFEAWARELRSQGQLTAELITQVRSMMENAGKGALDSILLPARVSTVAVPKELVWCFMTFVVWKLNGTALSCQKRLRLDQLVAHSNYPLSQFFKEQRSVLPAILPLFSSQQDVPFSVLEKKLELRELQMTYIFTTAIMKRYRDIYTAKFELSTPSNPSNDSNFRMGWVLFIMCKAVFLPVHADLVSCFHLLVAVLNFLVVHMPACNLRLKMDDPKDMPHKTSDGRVDTVQSLAANTNALASEVTWMVHRMDQLLVPILKEAGLQPCEYPDANKLFITSKYFPGVLDDSEVRKSALAALEAAYLVANDRVGRLYDELIFMEPDVAMGTAASPLRMSPRVSQWHPSQGSPFAFSSTSAMPSPLRKPFSTMMPSSPQLSSGGHSHGASMDGMTGALSSTAWLRELSSAVSVEPSKSLLRILRSCCPDKVDETVARVKELSEAVFPDEDDGGIMSQRREEAVKVYYRVLEAVLLGEERRTGVANITGLLNSNSFHRCLLACAAEVIIACYKMIVMPFPEVLERLGLKAFDIFKIIQCFVRHEPTLPRDIKRHLVSIEEQVVESMAWSAGSSLYPTLISAKLQLDDSSGRRQQVRQRKRTLTFSAADENEGRGPGESAPAPFNDKGIPAGLAKLKTRASSVQHHAVSASKPPVSPRTGELSTPNKVAGSVSSDISPGSPVTAGAESSVFHLIASPMPKKLRMDDSGVASSAGSPGLQAHPASTVMRSALPREIGEAIESPTSRDGPVVLLIRDFFKKATILSAVRLAQLCEHIAFGPYDHADILAKVYHVMRSCLFEHTHLLYGRHLDQLLLCSLYGVCKVLRLDHVTFKEITTHYKKQHSSSNHGSSGIPRQEIFRNVVIKFAENSLQPAEVGDIITFYNKAFIPTMKDFLVHVSSETPRSSAQPNDSGNPGPSMVSRTAPGTPPGLGRRSAVVAASPLRKCSGRGDQFPVPLSPHKTQVSADCNVFVSPMRKYEAQMTPRTKSLFCVGAVGDTSMNSPAALAMALSEAAQAVPCQRGGLEWQLGPQAFQENKQEPGSPSMSDGKVPGDSGSSGAENMEF